MPMSVSQSPSRRIKRSRELVASWRSVARSAVVSRVEYLLAGLVELVQRSGLAQLLRELRCGFRRRLGVRQQADKFVGSDGAVVGASDVSGQPQRLFRGAQLRLLESLTGDLGAERQCRQRENIADDLSLDFQRAVAGNARDRECRIGRQAVADQVRLSQRQFVIGGLQPAITEQCDLDRAVDCQWPPQQGFDGCIGTLCVIRRPDRHHVTC